MDLNQPKSHHFSDASIAAPHLLRNNGPLGKNKAMASPPPPCCSMNIRLYTLHGLRVDCAFLPSCRDHLINAILHESLWIDWPHWCGLNNGWAEDMGSLEKHASSYWRCGGYMQDQRVANRSQWHHCCMQLIIGAILVNDAKAWVYQSHTVLRERATARSNSLL